MDWTSLEKALRKHGLTARECQIGILSLQDVSVQEIAERMNLLEKSVKWYIRNAYTKMKAINHNEFFVKCNEAIASLPQDLELENLERYDYLENHLRDAGLSKGELGVALLLMQGMSNQEVADKLFVTEKTVKFHTTAIYKKLHVKCRSRFIFHCLSLLGITLDNKLYSPKFYKQEEFPQPIPVTIPEKLPVGEVNFLE